MSFCDVQIDEQNLVSAETSMATRGHGIAAVYGRAHESVTELYAIMKDGFMGGLAHVRRSA